MENANMFMRMIRDIFNVKVEPTNVVDVDEEMRVLGERLEAKRQKAIEAMGEKWILHPNNHVKKQDVAANSLGFKTA
jgi:hypothetical protein